MTVATARINVAADGTITGRAPREVPPGKHSVAIAVAALASATPSVPGDFPCHDVPWPESLSLRREDLYDDDGWLQ